MKRIKKVILKEAAVLNSEEMKQIFGGSGTESGDSGSCHCPPVSPSICAGIPYNEPCCYCRDNRDFIGRCESFMGYKTCFSRG